MPSPSVATITRNRKMATLNQAANMAFLPLDYSRKRKSMSRRDGTKNVAETLAKWKEYNQKLDTVDTEGKPIVAAHICYLVAEANVESYSDSERLCLMGAEHWKFPELMLIQRFRIDGARTAIHEAGTRLSSVKEEAKGEAAGLPGKMDIVEAKEEPRSIDQVMVSAPAPAAISIEDLGSEGKQYAYNNNLVLNLPFQLQNGEYQLRRDTQQIE
ncbi:hypothetical protein K7X08_031465 [Anisodus acutangulus]|uniref:Uncharacterized protein n=1 Tax=Anisodus acutangulus TaxID=402998 RepID=A0A9Q1RJC1_9SOLA|nr:hypothetical protein K7X08_031465 [Anisodus acutangulus]